MGTLTVLPSAVQEIMDAQAERELWIVGREFERPPYFHAGKGMDTRLAKALRVVQEDRIVPNSDGSFTVTGSEGRTYRCAESCSCPNSQKSSTKWCYHLISSALYVEWQKRVATITHQQPLPLSPVNVDERLAAFPHEESRMDNHDIPEPELAPESEPVVALLDEPPQPRPLPGPVTLPSLDARTLEQSMQAWSAQRQVVKRFLQQELKEGTDYYTLRIGNRETKPVLSKAGSEKFLGLFQLHATFAQDDATWTMLGQPQGTLCFVCHLLTRSGEVVGEGRGARSIKQDGGDINKAVKMAQKSSVIDAVLRTGALSEVFTQDLDEDTTPAPEQTPRATPTAQEYRSRIWALVQQLAPHATTREDVERYVQRSTGYPLHPNRYAEIVSALERSTP